MRILLVEDEEQIRKIVKLNLQLEGYEVVSTDNGKKALEIIDNQHFDILILDIMLPEVDGLTICQTVRLRNQDVGIMIISAKDEATDKIKGLKIGADDYLAKPFHLEEFLLRVQKLKKKSNENVKSSDVVFEFDGHYINFSTYEASTNNGIITMTQKEIHLLKLFVDKKNEVVSRSTILQTVWGYDVYPSTRTIDNFILAFRKYFEPDPKNPIYFHSVRSVGYKFTP